MHAVPIRLNTVYLIPHDQERAFLQRNVAYFYKYFDEDYSHIQFLTFSVNAISKVDYTSFFHVWKWS